VYEKVEQIVTEIMRPDLPIEHGRRELAEHLFSRLLTDPDGIPLINEAAIRHLEWRLEEPWFFIAPPACMQMVTQRLARREWAPATSVDRRCEAPRAGRAATGARTSDPEHP